MRLTTLRMGLEFGQLAKIRGIVYYKLSPFEQKAFPKFLSNTIPNTIRRFSENFWTVVPPFIVAYFVYDYYEKLSEQMKRKNPDDYRCDE